jgi:hypothetical protein
MGGCGGRGHSARWLRDRASPARERPGATVFGSAHAGWCCAATAGVAVRLALAGLWRAAIHGSGGGYEVVPVIGAAGQVSEWPCAVSRLAARGGDRHGRDSRGELCCHLLDRHLVLKADRNRADEPFRLRPAVFADCQER